MSRSWYIQAVLAFGLFFAAASGPVRADDRLLRVGGTGGDLGTMKQLAAAFVRENPHVNIEVLPSLGSGGGVKAVLAGAIGLGLTARPLKDGEKAAGGREYPYAKTALVMATSHRTADLGLTTDLLLKIYDGSVSKWPDGEPIRLILRPKSESDIELLMAHIPAFEVAYDAGFKQRNMPLTYSDQDMGDFIEFSRGSLGTTTLSLLLGENRQARALPLNGVAASSETIADGSYPLTKVFYFVTGPEPSLDARNFMDFVFSDAGKALLKLLGHQPLSADPGQ